MNLERILPSPDADGSMASSVRNSLPAICFVESRHSDYAMIAQHRTERRGQASKIQEDAVASTLVGAGLRNLRPEGRTIESVEDLPKGSFCKEQKTLAPWMHPSPIQPLRSPPRERRDQVTLRPRAGDTDTTIAVKTEAIGDFLESQNSRHRVHSEMYALDREIPDQAQTRCRMALDLFGVFAAEPWKSQADFQEAVKIVPELAAALIRRADDYWTNFELDKALADLDEAIRLDPQSAWAYTQRSLVNFAQGDMDKVLADHRAQCGEMLRRFRQTDNTR